MSRPAGGSAGSEEGGLSVVIIARNEADHIEACLRSVAWADQRVVLDTGSTDDTVSRARGAGALVERSNGWPGFGPARQLAERHATCPWVLRLDADERVSPELAESIRAAVAADDRSVVYHACQLTWCFGRYIRHSGWYPKWVERLYPRGKASWNDALVHESLSIEPGMRTARLAGQLYHYSYDTLREYLEKAAHFAEAWAEERRRRGRRASLAQGLGHGMATFLKMYLFRLGMLDGRAGFLLAVLSAHSTFVKYADLWLRDQPSRPAETTG